MGPRGIETFLKLHPVEMASVIERLDRVERIKVFRSLSKEVAPAVLTKLNPSTQALLLRNLDKDFVLYLLNSLHVDDVVDLLSSLPRRKAEELIDAMPSQRARVVKEVLRHPPETAGGLMTVEYVAVRENLTVRKTIKMVRKLSSVAKSIYYVYVVDERSKLVGVLSLRELMRAPPNAVIRDVMRRNVISVQVDTDQEEVAEVMSKYDLTVLPVVDEGQRLVGIVTSDDIMDVIVRETTEDIHKMGGMLSRIERLVDIPVLKAVRVRMPWLFICLAGGLVASGIIGAFEQILRTIIVLAFFIPVIMDMGGNVGVQSTTLIVRAMATKQIGTRDAWKAVRKELEIGALMGLVSGVLVGIAASVWQTPLIGLVVGIAMFLTLLVAASLGAVLPFLFRFVGVDPALTSGPFVTTIKDILALCIYFGVALSLAGYLLG